MLRVGLTGGIGSGKSTVARRLVEHGAVLIDADVLSREVVAPGTEGLREIVEQFGTGVLDSSGALDRTALAERVFADDSARVALNGIVHPRVARRTAEMMAAAPDDAVVVHDVPLLVENGYEADYHLVLVADAPIEDRVRRLVQRGLSETDARSRIDAQATEQQRREAADVWLDNGGLLEDLLAEVDRLWDERLLAFESNVRHRTRAGRTGPELVEHAPDWARQARRLCARIEKAAGDLVLRTDHIGSTSVPGLAAKDVVDIQVTVRSLDDADALAEPLGAAGFPVLPDIRGDNPHPVEPDPQSWRKRMHASADPGRRANVHLRVAGSAGWRFALLFRDWLCDDTPAREEYLRFKRAVAERFSSDTDHHRYADAKEPWFAEALPRARQWAERNGWQPPVV